MNGAGFLTILFSTGAIKTVQLGFFCLTLEKISLSPVVAESLDTLTLFNCTLTLNDLGRILAMCAGTLKTFVQHSTITGETFGIKLSLPSLETLKVNKRVSGMVFGEWMRFCGPNLKVISFEGINMTGDELSEFRGKFVHLQETRFSYGPTDSGIVKAIQMSGTCLKILSLNNTDLTGEGMSSVEGQLVNIEELNLSYCRKLTDNGLTEILKVCRRTLSVLCLEGTQITGPKLSVLGERFSIPNLSGINFGACASLTNQGLRDFLKISGPLLRSLDLMRTNVTGEGLWAFADKFVMVETLFLNDCPNLTDQGLSQMLAICGQRLKFLWLCRSNISGEEVALPAGRFPMLENLNLSCMDYLTDKGLLNLLRACGSKLLFLLLTKTTITGKGLFKLQGRLTHLQQLNLSTNHCLMDEGLCDLLSMCGDSLQCLRLQGTPVTGQGLEQLAGKFPKLRTICLSSCPNLTEQGLKVMLAMTGDSLATVTLAHTSLSRQFIAAVNATRPSVRMEN